MGITVVTEQTGDSLALHRLFLNSAMITIRPATAADLPHINLIYNHYVLHGTCTYQTEESTEEERDLWFAKHGEKHPVIVAIYEDQVIGWGSLNQFHPRAAYEHSVEDSIYVHHRCTGSGVGSMLLGELIRLAKELGHHTVLGGIDSSQEGSLALHLKFGFKECARYKEVGFKFGRWLDVIWMQKMLQ
jgi:L-amino acid N-acyltransferase